MMLLSNINFIDFDSKKRPAPTERNFIAIANQLDVFYDEASDTVMVPKEFEYWSRTGWSTSNQDSPWTDNDTQALAKVLIDSGLAQFTSKNKILDGVTRCALSNRRNLQKEHILSVEWDGVERVETLFIDVLGASDTLYTREVTKVFLAALIARVFNPGIKFDDMLVLVGEQGVGKSTVLKRLTYPYYCDSVTMSDMLDCKRVREKAGNSMLLEFAELSGLKRTEIEAMKGFLSSTSDSYREAYGKKGKTRPRSFVCAGTTNVESHEGFLRDLTGNRRFLIIPCNKDRITTSVFDLDDYYFHQVLSEAYSIYKSGQKLFLSNPEILAAAENIQLQFLETSDQLSLVEAYLDLPLPADFFKRPLTKPKEQHHNFLQLSPRDELIHMLLNSDVSNPEPGMIVRNIVTNEEVFRECFGQTDSKYSQVESRKITAMMLKLGWIKINKQKRIGGKKTNFYWQRPGSTSEYTVLDGVANTDQEKLTDRIERLDHDGMTIAEIDASQTDL